MEKELKSWLGWLQKRIPELKNNANEFWIAQALKGYKDESIEQLTKENESLHNLLMMPHNELQQENVKLREERDELKALNKLNKIAKPSEWEKDATVRQLKKQVEQLTKERDELREKNTNLIENGYYDDQPRKGSVDYLLIEEQLQTERSKVQELKRKYNNCSEMYQESQKQLQTEKKERDELKLENGALLIQLQTEKSKVKERDVAISKLKRFVSEHEFYTITKELTTKQQ